MAGWYLERATLPLAGPAKVLALAFTADGQTLISAYANKTIKLNDVQTGRELNTIADTASDDVLEAISIAFSNDGSWSASSTGDKTTNGDMSRPGGTCAPNHTFRMA